MDQALTLSQFNQRISAAVNGRGDLTYVWVVAETADVRTSGGHCYLELIEKDPANGRPLARIRAAIWANVYSRIYYKFMEKTGQPFRSDLKVMVCVSANFHPVFGLALSVSDIDPSYTLGDVLQRRNRIIMQLTKEGIIDANRKLQWPLVAQRIAVISARGAAGYGDFINQLYSNSSHLRFSTTLFEATLQGERTAPTVIAALERIAASDDQYDCVVIIRGGGASNDLLAFDDYDLAANIAMFPLPVVIGIGHERDITLLDYVANMRVKTPTAAAEWLVGRGERLMAELRSIASRMMLAVNDCVGGCGRQLAYIGAQLPALAEGALQRARSRLSDARMSLAAVSDRHLRPRVRDLDAYANALATALEVSLSAERRRLDSIENLLSALSPEATLRRGYTITRCGGKVVNSAADLKPGDILTTTFAGGSADSTVITPNTNS